MVGRKAGKGGGQKEGQGIVLEEEKKLEELRDLKEKLSPDKKKTRNEVDEEMTWPYLRTEVENMSKGISFTPIDITKMPSLKGDDIFTQVMAIHVY